MTESNRKNAEKIVGRQYVVVGEYTHEFPLGTVVTLTYDDGSDYPEFTDAAGEDWYVRMKDVLLLAETEETTEAVETPVAEKIEGRKYKVISEDNWAELEIGAVVTLKTDDGTEVPWFTDNTGKGLWMPLSSLELLPEEPQHITEGEFYKLKSGDKFTVISPLKAGNSYKVYCNGGMEKYSGKELTFTELSNNGFARVKETSWAFSYDMIESVEKVAEEPKVAEHKYAVGQKVKIVSTDEEECFTGRIGETAVVTAHEAWTGHSHTENGTPFYKVVLGDGVGQALTEYQLEPVDPFITEEQYQALEIGDTVVIRNDLEDGKWYGGNSIVSTMLPLVGKHATVSGDIGHRLGIKVKEAGYNWTQQMIADVIKKETVETEPEFDSPELIEGEIYVAKLYDSELWIYRYKKGDNAVSHSICLCVGSDYVGLHGTITHSTFEYRKATLDEAEQLIREEKKRGIEYQQSTENAEFKPEVGQFYSKKGSTIKVVGTKDKKVYGAGKFTSIGYVNHEVGEDCYLTKVADFESRWKPATDEQKIQLLTAMAEHGDATEADLDLLSELMPLDNPELEAGAVYVDEDNWKFRHESFYAEDSDKTKGFSLSPTDDVWKTGWLRISEYRKALPHEVAKLEAAEKEHGCVYQKPLINEVGTVIEVGNSYSVKSPLGERMIVKVTGKDGNVFNVSYLSQFSHKVTGTFAKNSGIWIGAELVAE